MTKRISFGKRLHLVTLSIFLVYAVSFILFQHGREKQYKINNLETKLQMYNSHIHTALLHANNKQEKVLNTFLDDHSMQGVRVTLIRPNGKVIYDNFSKDYIHFSNHATRPEVMQALKYGTGETVERMSKSLKQEYFYSASYYPKDSIIIRSALPYNNNLIKTLEADQHFLWFALVAIVVLTFFLYQYTSRLGKNIAKLSVFASRADHNESLDVESLANFPDDELGEIAERIIKIYKRLQSTRKEQDILKRQLTQNIAHELKTPIASIQGYLETILNNPNINDSTRDQFLKRCYAQSERLTSLLRDISTLNRMDDAPELMKPEKVNINELIDNIQKETALQIQEQQMTFNNLLHDNIVIDGTKSLLYSIFRNLTDNAIAYAGEGTKIELSATDLKTHWKFVFTDNGVGVPSEHLSRLFERFYRVDKGRSRKMGGTGLGLAIVKNAVLLHGGRISVRNNIGGGLRFEFTIRK